MSARVAMTGGMPLTTFTRWVRNSFGKGSTRRFVGAVAAEVQTIVAESFSELREPEGAPWKPIKRPRPGSRPLVKTRRLGKSLMRVKRSATTVWVDMVPYGPFHQHGTRRIPRRGFLPRFPLHPEIQMRFQRVILRVVHAPR